MPVSVDDISSVCGKFDSLSAVLTNVSDMREWFVSSTEKLFDYLGRPDKAYPAKVLKVFSTCGWLLSPTRKLIDFLKEGDRAHRGKALRAWSRGLFLLEVGGLVVLSAFSLGPPPRPRECRKRNCVMLWHFEDKRNRLCLLPRCTDLREGIRPHGV